MEVQAPSLAQLAAQVAQAPLEAQALKAVPRVPSLLSRVVAAAKEALGVFGRHSLFPSAVAPATKLLMKLL